MHARNNYRLLALLAPLAALAVAGTARSEDFHWQGHVPPGKVLEIKGVNGAIEAAPAAGGEAEVVAVKQGHRSDPSQVEVKAVEHAGGVTICAVYPSRHAGRPNECAPGEGGRLGAEDNDVDVHFIVKVPAGVRFTARTVNGSVDAQDLDGDVEARTVNGGIKAATKGQVDAETVNGSISASVGRSNGTAPLRFRTVNGGISVDLPEGTSADLRASTVNGEIETDFPLTVKGRFTGKSVSGALGSGGRELSLETVNGSIRLRKGR
jgi:putative adhesin